MPKLKLEDFSLRRSVRKYTDDIVPLETVRELIRCGTSAATGSNAQPWGFALVQDKAEIARWSDMTKAYILDNLASLPYLAQYEKWLQGAEMSVFNNASNLLVIYGDPASHWYVYDCSMVAGNFMLAAAHQGLGTCWIGFAEHTLNSREFKEQYQVPQNFQLVCPLTFGYPAKTGGSGPSRKEPVIFNLPAPM